MTLTLEVPGRMDALSAVNFMLDKYGEGQVSRLKETVSAVKAETILAQTSVDVQSEGWNFVTEEEKTLTPDVNKQILVPQDITQLVPIGIWRGSDWIIRDGKLYDRRRVSFEFSYPVLVKATRAYEFSELPQQAIQYITVMAAISFVSSEKPEDPVLRMLQGAATRARTMLEQYDNRLGSNNLVDVNPHFSRHRRKR